MVGGEEADVAAQPVLEAVGSIVVRVGLAGSGETVKAANQLIVAGTIQLVAGALVFLEAHGVDTEAVLPVLAGGLAGNRILDRKSEQIARAPVPARLPGRPASQGSRHRHRGRTRCRGGHPTSVSRSSAHERTSSPRPRRSRPLRTAAGGAALRPWSSGAVPTSCFSLTDGSSLSVGCAGLSRFLGQRHECRGGRAEAMPLPHQCDVELVLDREAAYQ